jgi:hypothetical protein
MKQDGYMPQHLRWALRAAVVALVVGLLCLLQGCGGGDFDDDSATEQPKTNQPVNCTQQPELCR